MSATAEIDAIVAEFQVIMGRPERVAASCRRIREALRDRSSGPAREVLLRLPHLLSKRAGAIAEPLFELLDERVRSDPDPWPLLEPMLSARDPALARRALERAGDLAEQGRLRVSRSEARALAEISEADGSPLNDAAALDNMARIVRRLDNIETLFVDHEDAAVRRLAARILDIAGELPPAEIAVQVLGVEPHRFLAPYLVYTRASHLDLLCLLPFRDAPPPGLESLKRTETAVGQPLLRQVVGELGWHRVNFGLEVVKLCGVRIGGSYPFRCSPGEVRLLEQLDDTRRTEDAFLFTAHGGHSTGRSGGGGGGGGGGGDDPVSRFRAYNLAHAEALSDILDVAALTREKVIRIRDRMDRIVEDYTKLFSAYSDECAVLPGLYSSLRERIDEELEKQDPVGPLSAELTRLVQMFEDPGSLGRVETLHGLKRYLHQKGLRLGFRLVEVGRTTNRTVDLVVASPRRVQRVYRGIHYVDFEPDDDMVPSATPYAVSVVVAGFGRQILNGTKTLPDVKIFCYGNEVHYFLAYGNHPAFLRIDYAPPLRGGMLDLEYYGVSKNELGLHPNPELDVLRLFFRKLEFDVTVDGTHVHARYDKERALDTADLCRKVEALFRLVPYLMEVDWVIGFLDLDAEAKRKVAEAWTEAFLRWGFLPLDQMLSRDRKGVVTMVGPGTTGPGEAVWDGHGDYGDRCGAPPPAGAFAALRSLLAELGIEGVALPQGAADEPAGQLAVETGLLNSMREAVALGQIVETPNGYAPAAPERFRKEHEAESFARILAGDNGGISAAGALARLVEPLERTLRFRTTGTVNGREVQRATLAMLGQSLTVCVLRDGGGLARLAFFALGDTLCRRRDGSDRPWTLNISTDAAELAALLRRGGFLPAGAETAGEPSANADSVLEDLLRLPGPAVAQPPLPGERIVPGLRASPGRAVGPVLFGTGGRTPEDFVGTVLLAPSLRPEDNTFLYRSAGVVSTGGGVLSHAGLIAIQFHKPALIIPGRWVRDPDDRPVLVLRTPEYRLRYEMVQGLHVTMRTEVREREHHLHEGDLVVLDADSGTFLVLGGHREALALHECLRHFGEAGRRLALADDARDILVLRGRRLRARHQIEKLMGRLQDPVLARHAVREFLVGKELAGEAGGRDERAGLLSLVLGNPAVGEGSREFLLRFADELRRQYRVREDEILRRLATAMYPFEIVSERLAVMRLRRALSDISGCLEACGFDAAPVETDSLDLDLPARRRLEEMRGALMPALSDAGQSGDPRFRHLVRHVHRLDSVLLTGNDEKEPVAQAGKSLEEADAAARRRLADARVLACGDGGFEVAPFVGWKAANLAEVQRLGGDGLVPPWFVVTDRAFRQVLDSPPGRAGGAVGEAVNQVLARDDIDHTHKSRLIRRLWDEADIPADLAREVIASYRKLRRDDEDEPFVSIRSSSREEDSELAARAGEFETFLFVRGEADVLDHLKRAWSGLWTERAIHNREVLGTAGVGAGGGIIVQRIVWSRVSGVLQTVNVAEGNLREMVVNAGLGLGEGVVSGTVGADQIVVSKEGDLMSAALRFRYVTADKNEQVVFNRRAGLGTVRSETLYHQRLRPALEYVELCALVRIAARLEAAYGYPLDIEFGIEGTHLWILQARPVATFLADLRETVERRPLAAAPSLNRGDSK